MAASGSGSSEKRLLFEDLDRPREVEPLAQDILDSSNPSSSSGQKRKKTPNPNWPPLEYTKEARCIGVVFYDRRTQPMLKRSYMNKNEDGYHQLTEDMRHELETKLEESEKCNNYVDYWLASDWLDGMVKSLTTNIVAMWRYVFNKKEDGSDWDDGDRELASKLQTIQDWCQGFSTSRNKRTPPWKESAENAITTHCISGSFKWLESSVRVVPMPDREAEGSYGTVRKVHLTKIASIPSWIEFSGKKLKTENLKEKRRDILLEAGGCPVKHPGIIRLSYLNPRTMEGYTLWWNGGSLQKFWKDINNKISEAVSIDDIAKQTHSGLNAQQLQWVKTYRKNRVNLALSFLVIVAKCHDENYLHNDLSPSNVLLHFDPFKENTVYIGICDWGLSGRVVEKEPSRYGYQTMKELDEVKAARKFAAPELFYIFGPPGSTNSLEVCQKKHLYTMEADAYAAGWIAERIWNEEWDSSYFTKVNPEQFQNLELKLKSLQRQNVKERATVSSVIEILKGKPYFWSMPQCCYRR